MFKKFISAGLLFWIPLIFTVWILDSVIEFSDRLLVFLPTQQLPAFLAKIPGLGLIFAVIIIFLTGVIVANVLGKKIVSWWEALLDRIPIVHPIYSGIKKIASTFLSQQSQSFQKVVMVEYPRKGAWTLAFVVNKAPDTIRSAAKTEENLLTVFVPTAPNPTSGYVIFVPESETRETSFGIEEAFTFHVSMGVVAFLTLDRRSSAKLVKEFFSELLPALRAPCGTLRTAQHSFVQLFCKQLLLVTRSFYAYRLFGFG